MIVTAHYKDGTTQDFDCPSWARWIEYDAFAGVYVWGNKPSRSSLGFFYSLVINRKHKFVGEMLRNQRKNHELTLHKIEFV